MNGCNGLNGFNGLNAVNGFNVCDVVIGLIVLRGFERQHAEKLGMDVMGSMGSMGSGGSRGRLPFLYTHVSLLTKREVELSVFAVSLV